MLIAVVLFVLTSSLSIEDGAEGGVEDPVSREGGWFDKAVPFGTIEDVVEPLGIEVEGGAVPLDPGVTGVGAMI